MTNKPSNAMELVLAFVREHGGIATPIGGGYWTAGGENIPYPTVSHSIYALERRGLLTRRNFSKDRWKDSYAVLTVRPGDPGFKNSEK